MQIVAWIAMAATIAAFGPLGCDEQSTDPRIDRADWRIDRANWRIELTLGGERFDLALATTPTARRNGLMHVAELPREEGMLFVFADTERRSFWMKDCLIDLDAIFLDERGRVVKVHEMTTPPPDATDFERYPSGEPARFVIELNRGMASELGIEAGDVIELPTADLKAMAE